MHVLIIPSWYPSHSADVRGSFFREQAQALARASCQVGVIYPQLRSLRQLHTVCSGPYGIFEDSDEGVPTLRYHGMSWFPRIPKLQAAQWVKCGLSLYAEYVDKYGEPDVIHAHSLLYGGCLASAILQSEGVPFVVTEHSSAFARGMLNATQRKLAQNAARQSERRFAVSAKLCCLLDKQLGPEASGWLPLPNMVRQNFLSAPSILKDKEDRFVFLHVSLLNANKSVDKLISAYADAFGGCHDVALEIGGNGPERNRLEALTEELGISEHVHFLGVMTRSEVLGKMQKCDVFVLSSKYETFSVVLIEALALGKPVISTRCGGPDSIVREQDGLLVPVDDVASMAGAMRQMRNNYSYYDSAEIRASCAARFSEKAVTDLLMAQYEGVCRTTLRQKAG